MLACAALPLFCWWFRSGAWRLAVRADCATTSTRARMDACAHARSHRHERMHARTHAWKGVGSELKAERMG
eukprot:4573547-Pleurochrysis_carterae.AAC.1